MRNSKVILIVAVIGLVFCGAGALSAAGINRTVQATVAADMAMKLDGKDWHPLNTQQQPIHPVVIDGASYLPVRALSDALQVPIDWDPDTRTILIGESPAQTEPAAHDHAHADEHGHADAGTSANAAESAAPGTDLTKLPLGDGKYTMDGPKKGYIFVASPPNTGKGATKDGEWINQSEGTYDMTRKAVVDGSVTWHSELTVELNEDRRVLTGNRLPDHPTGEYPIDPSDDAYAYDRNPNTIKEQLFKLIVPVNPVAAAKPSPVGHGAIGVMLTGSLVFNGLDEMGRDAVAHEVQDGCYGHPEKSGSYHYHNLSVCSDDPDTGEHSPLVGYALDGFGIYGKYGENGKLLTNDDLDAFHGHTHLIEWDGEMVNMYHYHATYEYPYTIGAFKGTPAAFGK